jgi:hypothetical protein
METRKLDPNFYALHAISEVVRILTESVNQGKEFSYVVEATSDSRDDPKTMIRQYEPNGGYIIRINVHASRPWEPRPA